jgi:hypothetical protein
MSFYDLFTNCSVLHIQLYYFVMSSSGSCACTLQFYTLTIFCRFICTVDGALTAWLPWSMGWSSGARHMASRALLVVVEPGAVIIRE